MLRKHTARRRAISGSPGNRDRRSAMRAGNERIKILGSKRLKGDLSWRESDINPWV